MKDFKGLYPAFVMLVLALALFYQSRVPKVVVNPTQVHVVSKPKALHHSKPHAQAPKHEDRQPARVYIFRLRGVSHRI